MRTRLLLIAGGAALLAGCSVAPYPQYTNSPGYVPATPAYYTYQPAYQSAYQPAYQPVYQPTVTAYPFYSSYAPESQAGTGGGH